MKNAVIVILFIFIVIIIIPIIIVRGLFFFPDSHQEIIINVYVKQEDKVVPMQLSEYLKGVIAAEMPARYNIEALKAQAVAARTYTMKQLPAYGGNGCPEHPEADISTDYRTDQAWISKEEMKQKWGFLPFFYLFSKITRAENETKGEVLTYNGELIDAVYHSNSGGQTEYASNVWGRKTPYLVSVDSPYDREGEKNYQHTVTFTMQQFDKKTGTNLMGKIKELESDSPSSTLKALEAADENQLIKVSDTTESGRVKKIKIAGKEFTGSKLRSLLDLPSTKFKISLQENKVVCTVYGNGHGVGMSQDGANGYANHGYSYQAILKHYYQGTNIDTISNIQK